MGCVFRLGIAQRKWLRSVKNRAAILFWGGCGKIRVAQKGQSPLSAWDFGCWTSRSYFVLHFSQPAGASFGWAWHRQRFFLRELTARYAPNARFASFGRDNRDYMARIARDARPRLGFASQTRTFGAYLAFDSRNDAHSARFLPYSRRFPGKRQEARALCVDLASTECGKIGTGGVSCLGSAFASPAKDSDGAFSRLA